MLPDDAVLLLRRLPFADLGFAKVDHHRSLRQGLPEAVYGQGKTADQCSAIVGELLAACRSGADQRRRRRYGGGSPVILTRADEEQATRVLEDHPGGTRTVTGRATGADQVRGELSTVVWRPAAARVARTLVITAGTSDLPVAARMRGHAGGARTPADPAGRLRGGRGSPIAGVGRRAGGDRCRGGGGGDGGRAGQPGRGNHSAPVVAVPTSTGYGAALEGVTALLAMHASCAAGITVVGIDNGFGAACAIARMLP